MFSEFNTILPISGLSVTLVAKMDLMLVAMSAVETEPYIDTGFGFGSGAEAVARSAAAWLTAVRFLGAERGVSGSGVVIGER